MSRCLRFASVSVLVGCLIAVGAQRAYAYWDDVHYHLTYFIARRVGFTPEQAYRIAAACLSTDYDKRTEPTQGKDPTEANQRPRWMFHALRNEIEFKTGAVGNGVNAKAASDLIPKRARELFDAGVAAKNPGMFLHFLQDVRPHQGFGSAWGHYPLFDADSIKLADDNQLPIGGSVDWLSHQGKNAGLSLVSQTARWLDEFARRASPHHRKREFSLLDVEALLDQLIAINEAPKPLLSTELDDYQWHFADARGLLPYQFAPKITAEQKKKFDKHVFGPDLDEAERRINADIAAKQMVEGSIKPYVPARKAYTFDTEGKVAAGQRGAWVLTGSLEVEVRSDDPADTVAVDVSIKAPPTMADEQEYDLGESRPIKPGASSTWTDLPVGKVIVDVTRDGKPVVRKEFFHDQEKSKTTIFLGAMPWALEPGAPKLRWVDHPIWKVVKGYPKLEPESGPWQFKRNDVVGSMEGPLLPGGKVTLLYESALPGGFDVEQCELVITQSKVKARNTVRRGELKAEVAFEFTIVGKPMDVVRPGDKFSMTLAAKATKPAGDALEVQADANGDITDAFTDHPKLEGFHVGFFPDRTKWVGEKSITVEFDHPKERDLDWGLISFAIDALRIGPGVYIEYLYRPGE